MSARPGLEVCTAPCFNKELVRRLRAHLPAEDELERARAVFAGLADPWRLRIVRALAVAEELCVCDVAHVLGTTVSTASHHLRRLRRLGLLRYRSDGKMVYYSLRDGLAAELVRQVLALEGRRGHARRGA